MVQKKLDFKLKDATKEPVKYLWYVGDFASFNQNCQETTRKVAQVCRRGVDFGIMGKKEKSAGKRCASLQGKKVFLKF
jgi:hypothetical protein